MTNGSYRYSISVPNEFVAIFCHTSAASTGGIDRFTIYSIPSILDTPTPTGSSAIRIPSFSTKLHQKLWIIYCTVVRKAVSIYHPAPSCYRVFVCPTVVVASSRRRQKCRRSSDPFTIPFGIHKRTRPWWMTILLLRA